MQTYALAAREAGRKGGRAPPSKPFHAFSLALQLCSPSCLPCDSLLPDLSCLPSISLADHERAAVLALARLKFPCSIRSLSCFSADNKGCFSVAWCCPSRLQAARGTCCSSFSLFLLLFSLPRSSHVKAVLLLGTQECWYARAVHLCYWWGCFSESNV